MVYDKSAQSGHSAIYDVKKINSPQSCPIINKPEKTLPYITQKIGNNNQASNLNTIKYSKEIIARSRKKNKKDFPILGIKYSEVIAALISLKEKGNVITSLKTYY